MWPTPRAPISTTRKRVCGVTRKTVSGTPTSEFSEPTGATVGAALDRTLASRSLVEVLPERAGDADDGQVGVPVDDGPGQRGQAGLDVLDDDARAGRRPSRVVIAATAPSPRRTATNWWPSICSPMRAM